MLGPQHAVERRGRSHRAPRALARDDLVDQRVDTALATPADCSCRGAWPTDPKKLAAVRSPGVSSIAQSADRHVEIEILHALLVLRGVDHAHRASMPIACRLSHIGRDDAFEGLDVDQEFDGRIVSPLALTSSLPFALPAGFGEQAPKPAAAACGPAPNRPLFGGIIGLVEDFRPAARRAYGSRSASSSGDGCPVAVRSRNLEEADSVRV